MKSFSETIDFLRENLNGLSDAEKTAAVSQIFGGQASAGILAILKTSDKDYEKLTNAIDNCDGKTKEMADTMQNNLSGQFTILKSQLQELAISFGEVLLPKIKKLVSWVQGIVDKLNKLSPQARGVIAVVSLIVASIGPLLIVMGTLIGGIGSAFVNFKKLYGFIKGFPSVMTKLSGVFSKIGTAIGGISAPVLIVIAVIVVLVAAFKHLWDTNEEFRNKIIVIWDGIVAKIQAFVQAVKEKFAALNIDFETIVAVLKGIWDAFCNFLAPIFEGAFQLLSDALSAVLDVIVGILDVFICIFTGNWSQAWEGIKEIFVALWNFIVNTLKNVLITLREAANSILKEWGMDWKDFWTMIKDFYIGIWKSILAKIHSIKDSLFSVWDTIKTGVANRVNGIKNKIVDGFNDAVNYVHGLISDARSWGSDMMQNIINGLHDKIQDLADGVTDVANTIRDFLHFSVPDKGPLTDYENWMPDFMKGMAKGIERSRGLIQKAISHVSGDMVITPTTSAALIGGYGTTAVSNTTNNSNVTYNFNQTNNSPKALSRFDIYRQSKNLLSGVKGR